MGGTWQLAASRDGVMTKYIECVADCIVKGAMEDFWDKCAAAAPVVYDLTVDDDADTAAVVLASLRRVRGAAESCLRDLCGELHVPECSKVLCDTVVFDMAAREVLNKTVPISLPILVKDFQLFETLEAEVLEEQLSLEQLVDEAELWLEQRLIEQLLREHADEMRDIMQAIGAVDVRKMVVEMDMSAEDRDIMQATGAQDGR